VLTQAPLLATAVRNELADQSFAFGEASASPFSPGKRRQHRWQPGSDCWDDKENSRGPEVERLGASSGEAFPQAGSAASPPRARRCGALATPDGICPCIDGRIRRVDLETYPPRPSSPALETMGWLRVRV